MNKQRAIRLFGSGSLMARAIGCTPSAVFQWPESLPRRIADRVIAACVRKGIDPTPLLDMEKEGNHEENHHSSQ